MTATLTNTDPITVTVAVAVAVAIAVAVAATVPADLAQVWTRELANWLRVFLSTLNWFNRKESKNSCKTTKPEKQSS